ncbi:MAG: hypothetical protein IJF75_03035 [Clostridia bacterium]|nr:hypothetical protein [Clostridia bacterium]
MYFNPEKCTPPETILIDDDSCSEELHRLLNCTFLDFTFREFSNKSFYVIIDDCGRSKAGNYVSTFAINSNDSKIIHDIFGSIIIAGFPSDDGYITALSEDDVKLINRCLIKYQCANGIERFAFLLDR